MVANILPATPPPLPSPAFTLGFQKVKIQLFKNMIMFHIQLKGGMNAATWWQMFCLQTLLRPPPSSPDPEGEVKRSKFIFQNMVMLHIKLNGSQMQQHGSIYLPTDLPLPRDPGEGTKIKKISEHGHVAYQIKGNHKRSNMVQDMLPLPYRLYAKRSKLNSFRTWSCCI